jgi:isoleucyl-tRNA synthetase
VINEVAGQYNAQDIEAQVRDLWEKSGTYSKTRSKRSGGKKFFFVDGPPYTTGRIHLGTAWNKVIKDAVLRYKSMNGNALQDRAGWDIRACSCMDLLWTSRAGKCPRALKISSSPSKW